MIEQSTKYITKFETLGIVYKAVFLRLTFKTTESNQHFKDKARAYIDSEREKKNTVADC